MEQIYINGNEITYKGETVEFEGDADCNWDDECEGCCQIAFFWFNNDLTTKHRIEYCESCSLIEISIWVDTPYGNECISNETIDYCQTGGNDDEDDDEDDEEKDCNTCEECGGESEVVHSFGCVALCAECSITDGEPHCPIEKADENHFEGGCSWCWDYYQNEYTK